MSEPTRFGFGTKANLEAELERLREELSLLNTHLHESEARLRRIEEAAREILVPDMNDDTLRNLRAALEEK